MADLNLLLGVAPFEGSSLLDILQRVLTAIPVPPSEIQPRVPKELDLVILRCLEKDPKKRFRTVGQRAVALTSHEQISIDDLPEKVRSHKPAELLVASLRPSELVTLEEIERRYILRVLEALGGNRALAAQILGVDRRTLYRKLERYGQPA